MHISVSMDTRIISEFAANLDDAFLMLELLAEQYPDWRFLGIMEGASEVLFWVESERWFVENKTPEAFALLEKVLGHSANAGISGRKLFKNS